VQRAGDNVYARLVPAEEAGEDSFVEAINAFERVEEREARLDIEHQADLTEGARQFQQRDPFGGELGELHGGIESDGGGGATLGAGDDD
jgi:hypothetical protein